MADKVELNVLFKAVIDPTLGRAFADVEGQVARLRRQAEALAKQEEQLSRSPLRLSLASKGLQWKADGFERMGKSLEQGKAAVGDMATLWKALSEPVKISADYQAIVNDVGPLVGKQTAAEKKAFGDQLAAAARANGIDRDELARAAGKLASGGAQGAGILDEARLLSIFSVGQGVSAGDTAALMNALRKTSGAKDGAITQAAMRAALTSVAQLSGGEFGAEELAKHLPALLMEMKKLGITGQEAVLKSVALLNEQAKTAATSDDAAKGAKEVLAKLGARATKASGEYPPVPDGVLARNYLNKLPGQEVKPDAGRLGNDQQDKRGQSKELWADLDRSVNEAKRSIGDAIQPYSDMAAKGLTALTDAAGGFARSSPAAVAGIVGIVGAISAFRVAKAGFGMLRGAGEFGIGTVLGRLKVPRNAAEAAAAAAAGGTEPAAGGAQKVFVVNWPGETMSAGSAAGDAERGGSKRKGRKNRQASAGAARAGLGGGIGGGRSGGTGGNGGSAGSSAAAGTGGRPAAGAGSQAAGGAAGAPVPARGRAGMLDRLKLAPKLLGRLGRRSLGSLGAAYEAYEVLRGPGTAGDKARGLGKVGGSLAGGAAGAQAGALIGAFGGPIGAAVGGLIGGGIGAALGAEGIDALGNAWAARRKRKADGSDARNGAGNQAGEAAAARASGAPRLGGRSLAVSATAGIAMAGAGALLYAGMRSATRPDALPVPPAAGAPAQPHGALVQAQALAAGGAAGSAASAGGAAQARPPSVAAAPSNVHFSPTISVTVQGDAKDPRRIAEQLLPHLQRLMGQFQAQRQRGSLFDVPTF
ncbi:hypothetical protein ASC94_28690 [Massilia sp. Root418]|uniref:phage tail tape measure protein n=1 Tax=Massilia sp. Root418 TaxID=1736532 RepID=UPI0006F90876|nr:phage tail tape measure protein [Massilia sp. Root418]KQW87363.1 hypothetical protein ASC94_28690 [Massilia sp. Root418]